MKGIWDQTNALRVLVLPLRGKLDNKSCLFVAVDSLHHPPKQEEGKLADFFNGKTKEFQELVLQASNLTKRDYEQAIGLLFYFFFCLFFSFFLSLFLSEY